MEFISESFDAIKLLYSDRIVLPFEGAYPLDNIMQCKILLTNPLAELKRTPKIVTDIPISRTKEREMKMIQKLNSSCKFVNFMEMIESKLSGPFDLLHTMKKTQHPIRVILHEGKELIGEYHGILKAFDKHSNLIKRKEVILKEYGPRKRGKSKMIEEKIESFHSKIFLRGEFIVSISKFKE